MSFSSVLKLFASQLGVFAFLGLSTAVLFASWRIQQAENQRAQLETAVLAEQASLRLRQFVEARLYAINTLSRGIGEGDVQDESEFVAHADWLRNSFPGIQAINWINAEGVIQWVSPQASNEGALRRNVFEHPAAGKVIAEAKRTSRPTMSTPLNLFQGGKGVTVYSPVPTKEGVILGYVNAVFRTDTIVQTVFGGEQLGAFDLVVLCEGKIVFGSLAPGGSFSSKMAGGHRSVELLNRKWDVYLSARGKAWGEARRPFDIIMLLSGMALSLLLSIAIQLLINTQNERRRVILERVELEEKLHQAKKMEAVGKLAGGVAHDFNNLLTAILGNVELLMLEEGLDEEAQDSLNEIQFAGKRAAQLTGQLLTISRKRVVQKRPIDVVSELEALSGVLRRLIREDIKFSQESEDESMVIDFDPTLLTQVVINLVVNSVDAMPRGGELCVETTKQTEGEGVERIDWIVLTVRDSGVGMDEATRDRVLDPFFTTKESGTGMGLATVDDIVREAGGRIVIEDNYPKGTCISVWFLSSHGPVSVVGPLSEAVAVPGGDALFVEDEASVRQLGVRLLEDLGYRVTQAEHGAAALDLVERGLTFDLLVTDAVMPQINGPLLLMALRERGHQFDAVVASGYSDDLHAADFDALGAAFLAKPYTSQLLSRAIRAASRLSQRKGAAIEAERVRGGVAS